MEKLNNEKLSSLVGEADKYRTSKCKASATAMEMIPENANELRPIVSLPCNPLGYYFKRTAAMSSSASWKETSYPSCLRTVPLCGPTVKVSISPRFKKLHKLRGCKSKVKSSDSKFSIFEEEEPKSHIVHVDRKLFQANMGSSAMQFILKKKKKKQVNASVDKKANESYNKQKSVQLLKQYNKPSTEQNVVEAEPRENPVHTTFSDSMSYLSYHQKRLQRLLEEQEDYRIIKGTSMKSGKQRRTNQLATSVTHFKDANFRILEESALLAQSRCMLNRWRNPDQLLI